MVQSDDLVLLQYQLLQKNAPEAHIVDHLGRDMSCHRLVQPINRDHF